MTYTLLTSDALAQCGRIRGGILALIREESVTVQRIALPRPAAAVGVSLFLAVLLAWLDYLVGIEISFSIFYLLPISLVTWSAHWRAGVAMAFLCAALWLVNDHFVGGHVYSNPSIPYWNAGVRLGFFVLTVWLLTRLREAVQHAEALSATMSDMLALVSHEFNNALTSLHLALGLLRERSAPSPESEELYASMDRAHRRLMETVANFLSQARIRSGRFTLDVRPTIVRRLVHESVAILEPIFRRKGVEVVVDAPSELYRVGVDPDAMAIVFTNLIGNAVKYTPAGGRVCIRITVPDRSQGQLEVSVEDTGIGIAPEDRERITEGFYRTERSRNYAPGYGIGLKVSQEMLRAHGSSLLVESAPGHGSRFSFCLPLWREGAAPPADQGV